MNKIEDLTMFNSDKNSVYYFSDETDIKNYCLSRIDYYANMAMEDWDEQKIGLFVNIYDLIVNNLKIEDDDMLTAEAKVFPEFKLRLGYVFLSLSKDMDDEYVLRKIDFLNGTLDGLMDGIYSWIKNIEK